MCKILDASKTMLLKTADDKTSAIATLKALADIAQAPVRQRVENELRMLQAGIHGENTSAYQINFYYGHSDNWIVMHDLRLECKGRVAQIDHLLINRLLECYILETKWLASGVKITETGEFLRWKAAKNNFEGMASPIAQNEMHRAVLEDVFSEIELPTRLGVRLKPTVYPLVLFPPTARVDRPKSFDTSMVVKADLLKEYIDKRVDEENAFTTVSSVAKAVSMATVKKVCFQVLAKHRPLTIDYEAKFGIQLPKPTHQVPAKEDVQGHKCRHCGSLDVAVQYGKFGYYFKCRACSGNTPIKVSCPQGHTERIRKDGLRFFRECAECKSSALFFSNPA